MSQVTGTTFGLGTPTLNPLSTQSWGLSPYAGPGIDPFGHSAYFQALSGLPQTGHGIWAVQPVQQILQLLQIVPQQLQQLQYLQQQQLFQLQQVLQFVPAQLHQLQQLIQAVPQQIQHLQRQALSSTIPGQLGFGFAQSFPGQPVGQVM